MSRSLQLNLNKANARIRVLEQKIRGLTTQLTETQAKNELLNQQISDLQVKKPTTQNKKPKNPLTTEILENLNYNISKEINGYRYSDTIYKFSKILHKTSRCFIFTRNNFIIHLF